MIILIPAYEPDHKLPALIRSIRAADPTLTVLVVDDGSGAAYTLVFDGVRRLGGTVIGHGSNRGKGYALKSGFGYIAEHFPGQEVICADCDGQHGVPDILRVAARVRSSPGAMVLGTRAFSGKVPFRSRFGNAVTGRLFTLATGRRIGDTQTGLRGYPAPMLGWLQSVPGDRFEYELRLLLQAGGAGYGIETVEIATIYLAGNESSHFRPLLDSARIYAPLLRFSLSSFTGFAVDTAAVLALNALTGSLPASVVGARALSSAVNFLINGRLVFADGRDKRLRAAALQYYALAAVLLAANYALLEAFSILGAALLPAKLLTEAALFAVSYTVQRKLLFVPAGSAPPTLPVRQ